jgi:hypothetical protein
MTVAHQGGKEPMSAVKPALIAGICAEFLFVGLMIVISVPTRIAVVYGTVLAVVFAVFTAFETAE